MVVTLNYRRFFSEGRKKVGPCLFAADRWGLRIYFQVGILLRTSLVCYVNLRLSWDDSGIGIF